MAAVNPSEPSQPSQQQAYSTQGNPASKEPAEKAQAKAQANDDSAPTDQRIPSQQTASVDEATPSSMGRGIRGAGPGEDASELTDQDMGRSQDVNAEQMEVPGEGKVASAVKGGGKSGGGAGQPGLESDLDRKKSEQAPMREAMQGDQGGQNKGVDVQGVLNSRGT